MTVNIILLVTHTCNTHKKGSLKKAVTETSQTNIPLLFPVLHMAVFRRVNSMDTSSKKSVLHIHCMHKSQLLQNSIFVINQIPDFCVITYFVSLAIFIWRARCGTSQKSTTNIFLRQASMIVTLKWCIYYLFRSEKEVG